MSRRGAVPVLVAVGVGVAAGYYQWMPLWDDRAINKMKAEEEKQAADLGPNLIEIPTQSLAQDRPRAHESSMPSRSEPGKSANG